MEIAELYEKLGEETLYSRKLEKDIITWKLKLSLYDIDTL